MRREVCSGANEDYEDLARSELFGSNDRSRRERGWEPVAVSVIQRPSAPPRHGGGCKFESRRGRSLVRPLDPAPGHV